MAGPSYSHAQLEELWILAGGSEAAADTAAAIAQAESDGCQYAQRGPQDIRPVKRCVYVHDPLRYVIGLWQINQTAHPQYGRQALFVALTNAEAAVAISGDGTNFRPWTTYTSGAYRRYLVSGGTPTAQAGATVSLDPSAAVARGLHGYADLRNSVASHLPNQLHTSRRQGAATLRLLGRGRRLRG